jgi:hypothetical protein
MDLARDGLHWKLRIRDVAVDVRLSRSLYHRNDSHLSSGTRIHRRTDSRPDGNECVVVG